jgi:hypothetical protein
MPVLLKRGVFVSFVGWIVGGMCLVVAHGGVFGNLRTIDAARVVYVGR